MYAQKNTRDAIHMCTKKNTRDAIRVCTTNTRTQFTSKSYIGTQLTITHLKRRKSLSVNYIRCDLETDEKRNDTVFSI